MSINTLKHNICQIGDTLSSQAETNILWPYVSTARERIIHISLFVNKENLCELSIVEDFHIGGRQKYTNVSMVENVFIHKNCWSKQ